MALTLLRHASLHIEHQNRYNGWTDINIDPNLFNIKEVTFLQAQTFDFVYSSNLLRCTQTLDLMGIENYLTDSRLREVEFREEIEGKNFNEIEKLPSYQKYYLERKETWHTYICKEPTMAFEARIRSFLEDIPKDKNILVCTHAGTIQKMMLFLGYAKNDIAYLEHIRIENGI